MYTEAYTLQGLTGEVLVAQGENDAMAGTCAACGERPSAHSAAEWASCVEDLASLDRAADAIGTVIASMSNHGRERPEDR